MSPITKLIQYLANLSNGKIVLWCYLVWYINTVIRYFDPSPGIWLNSAGISALIGAGLILSVGGRNSGTADRWQTFRLFAMPFCVSSFSSLIKGRGFILIVPPSIYELLISIGLCASFAVVAIALRKNRREKASNK